MKIFPPKTLAEQAANIEEAAARWALLRTNGRLSQTQSAELEHWIARSDQHAEAFADAARALELVKVHAGSQHIVSMRADALAERGERLSHGVKLGVGALLAATLALAVFGASQPGLRDLARQALSAVAPQTAEYQTGVGERATISLPDGSVATLDTQSEFRVDYTIGERGVRLLRGQALFEVAKHRNIPFRVYANGQRITAVGTKFNVRLLDRGLKLTLVEGRVRVDRASPTLPGAITPTTELAAGEVLEAHNGAAATVRMTDTSRDISWPSGLLIFQDETLDTAVTEMNRYATVPIRIDGRFGGQYRVSGVFKTGDPERFARAMTEVFPLSLTHGSSGEPVLVQRP
ncbi:MAG: FecR domain-containing protein [Caulobacteraceae bacterium]|nr:FecR domain-containing protein [Caulobacteraceae bacterium]